MWRPLGTRYRGVMADATRSYTRTTDDPVFSSSNHDGEMEAMAIKGLLDSNDIPAMIVGPARPADSRVSGAGAGASSESHGETDPGSPAGRQAGRGGSRSGSRIVACVASRELPWASLGWGRWSAAH